MSEREDGVEFAFTSTHYRTYKADGLLPAEIFALRERVVTDMITMGVLGDQAWYDVEGAGESESESDGESETEGGGELEPARETASAAIYCAVWREALDARRENIEPESGGESVARSKTASRETEMGISGPEFGAMFARFQRIRRDGGSELAYDEIWDHYECVPSCQAWYDRLCHVGQARTVYDQIAALVFAEHRGESTVAPGKNYTGTGEHLGENAMGESW